MKYKKIALLSKAEVSSWKSCQSITGNLEKAYLSIFSDNSITSIKVVPGFNRYQAYKTAIKIFESEIDLIIWFDHQPNAACLLDALCSVYSNVEFEKRPKLIVHLFGDFVLDCLGWESVQDIIRLWPIHFFVASHRQEKLVKSFFLSANNIATVIPFPVDENIFNTNNLEKNRHVLRSAMGLTEEDKVLLYTGRVSYQKNIEMLIKVFASVEPLMGGRMHLLIAGGTDDLLMPYFGKHGLRGSFYAQIKVTLNASRGSKVKFLGQCEIPEIVKLYHASDLFVSLSTHNDEDYGMSPAEALSCGLPALLSNWGGYGSFHLYSKHVSLINTEFSSFRPLVDSNSTRREMINNVMGPHLSVSQRREGSNLVKEYLSIENVGLAILKKLSAINFGAVEAFSPKFYKLCTSFKMYPHSPLKNSTNENELSELYKEIYDVYRF